ncbi:Rne/Rng family ribonuclease [Pseudothioclava nitratireducens]|uniref:Rne/Rng family ribonuclease n=1 Tax=Pseudothioclava nitratireducens TaxID=1928646 RepID=UPI0023D9AB5E|nr:ribonuclease E/G [Defluviimonas nitratireducens]MDF1619324.1 Rne/Rng family ribonuclease [Defluviimonas nitratireducens]
MAKKMLIDATHAEETRVVVVDGNKVEEFDFETINKRQLAGNIYLAKVTRVEPSLQAAFVDYGGNRHGFLAFAEIHPDYYQIPVADRQALLEEERALAEAEEREAEKPTRSRRRRSRGGSKAEKAADTDAVVKSDEIPGMEVLDADQDGAIEGAAAVEADPALMPAEGSAVEASAEIAEEDLTVEAETGSEDAAVAELAAESEVAEVTEEVEADEENHDHDHHAHPTDDSIESVADEDVAEEIRAPRKPRPRRYKIQEVIKVRQIMLVQVVKEERGNKGAALTTYLSLAGRYCVLMPNTARGGGISRKITNAADRKKLKEIAGEMEVPQGAGLIIRTAGAQRTKTEIKRDYEYLMRLWEQIRDLTMESVAPAPIYEEGDLIKRSIRDLYSRDIDEVLVEGERGYRAAKDFMKMIMPSHAKNVKHYAEALPLFARFQVESYLGQMFNPTVQLKSGGYIVIGVTEALVAIDVNSGRATKEGSIEETALKTNLEAAEEVARQLRLRDLAGLIVIDFIDMEERKNNAAVEKKLKDKLKTDRARIQVGRISGFGLLEMSRQRLRPGMLESTTQPCPHCHGTGLIRSDDSLALQVLRAIEEEGTRKRSREVLVKCPVAVANYLMNAKREHVAMIEARYGMSVRIEADPTLVSPDFSIEKFKTATRVVPEVQSPVVSVSASLMAEIDEEDEVEEIEEAEVAEAPDASEDDQPKKKKRRRRRRRKSGPRDDEGQDGSEDDLAEGDDTEQESAEEEAAAEAARVVEADIAAEEAPKKKRTSRSRKKKTDTVSAEAPEAEAAAGEAEGATPETAEAEDAPAKKPSTRLRRKKTDAPAEGAEPKAAEEAAPKKRTTRSRKKKVETVDEGTPETPEELPAEAPVEAPTAPPAETPVEAPVESPVEAPVEAPVDVPQELPQQDAGLATETLAETVAEAAEDASKPRRRGWWSVGR